MSDTDSKETNGILKEMRNDIKKLLTQGAANGTRIAHIEEEMGEMNEKISEHDNILTNIGTEMVTKEECKATRDENQYEEDREATVRQRKRRNVLSTLSVIAAFIAASAAVITVIVVIATRVP